ncbi:putative transcription factor/ chromatin remodeling BED-type(Zn) family [Arabidopsis thaliana]
MDSDLEPVALTPQKQDSAWKHCEVYKYGDRVQMRCLYCRKMFKGGGITRVKEHLAGKKGQGTICDQVPDEVRLFLQQCIDGTVRRQRKRRKSSPEPLPIAYFPPCEVETQVAASSDVNNGF